MDVKEVTELKIPVPWGHIAAKAWGDKSKTPILVFHGRMDNAGGFDNLIPLLSDAFYYVCVDFPSHGKSSHFPPHLPIYSLNYLLAYTLVMRHFERKSYAILGHSLGGHLGILYSRLYPDRVDKIITVDTIHTDVVPAEYYSNYLGQKLDGHLRLVSKLSSENQPRYTYEEAVSRVNAPRAEPLTEKAVTSLLNRGLELKEDGKYVFTLDQRMKDYLDQMHDFPYALKTLKYDPVPCPVLMILGNRNPGFHSAYQPVLDWYRKLENFSIELVEGGHDVHNNQPEVIAPLINRFLLNQDCKKISSGTRSSPNLSFFARLLKLCKL